MPAGAIEHHHDLFAGMASGQLVEKRLHAVRVDVRQDQGIQHAARHIHRGVGVGVFVGQCRPPRGGVVPSPTTSPRMKASRNRLVQPTDKPIICAVASRLRPCSSGNTTACACRNCSTVLAAAIAARASPATSCPLAILAITSTAIGCDGQYYSPIDVEME